MQNLSYAQKCHIGRTKNTGVADYGRYSDDLRYERDAKKFGELPGEPPQPQPPMGFALNRAKALEKGPINNAYTNLNIKPRATGESAQGDVTANVGALMPVQTNTSSTNKDGKKGKKKSFLEYLFSDDEGGPAQIRPKDSKGKDKAKKVTKTGK